MRGLRFRVFKVTRAKSEVFLTASPLVLKTTKLVRRSFFFFAARAFGRTTREKPLVPLARTLILCKPLAFIGKTLKKYVKNSLKYRALMKTHFKTESARSSSNKWTKT